MLYMSDAYVLWNFFSTSGAVKPRVPYCSDGLHMSENRPSGRASPKSVTLDWQHQGAGQSGECYLVSDHCGLHLQPNRQPV